LWYKSQSVLKNGAYDIEIFGEVRENDTDFKSQFYEGAPGVWKRAPGEAHVSQKYQKAMHHFDKMEKNFYYRVGKLKSVGTYVVEKPVHAAIFVIMFVTGLYWLDKGIRRWLCWLCQGKHSNSFFTMWIFEQFDHRSLFFRIPED